jgi:hypothetical protein
MTFSSVFDVRSTVFGHDGQVVNFDEAKQLISAAVVTMTAEVG